jgi:pilus assembly protein CpaE
MSENKISAVVVHDPSIPGEWVLGHLADTPGLTVMDVVDSLNEDGILRALRSRADVCVIACGENAVAGLTLVTRWHHERGDSPVVVLTSGSANGFVREAFDAGADDIVVLGTGPDISPTAVHEVTFTIQKALARRASPGENAGEGRLICILGPKGGIGKTLTSCNLGVCLAEAGQRVALVDLDLQFGDLALSLRLTPDRTIYDLATSGGTLDAEKVEGFMAPHPSGMRVMLAPIRPDQAASITVEFLRELYAVMRQSYDFIVVDTPPGFSPEVIATIDESSEICMIGMLDALSLKNTKLGLETLELMGYQQDRIRLVLNRADTSVGITHTDVVSIVGRSPDVLVPSNREITRSVNDGVPISTAAAKSEAAKAFRALAALYVNRQPDTAPRRTGRFLRGRS